MKLNFFKKKPTFANLKTFLILLCLIYAMVEKVAVVIPTKNEAKTLPFLVCSLKNQNLPRIKIFVADANSSDKTREIAKKMGCVVVDGGTPTVGRNNGAQRAIKENSKILIFIDSDVILPSKDFLKKSLEEFNQKKLDLAGTTQIPLDLDSKLNLKNIFKSCKHSYKITYNLFYGFANIGMKLNQHSKNPFMQNCMFAKSEVHKTIKGFQPLEFGEDSKYSEDAVKHGYKFGILESGGKVFVSPRRLESKGFLHMLWVYAYFNVGRIIFKHEFIQGITRRKYFD